MIEREKVNILLVDDQPGKLLSYEAILDELGENLIRAASGKEALDHLLKNDIAVVLLDVSMPEIDGFELADMIRQHPRFQNTAIIFVSAIHLTDLDRLKGYGRGAVDYVSVPVDAELLRAKVHVFADLYRKTKELEDLNAELRRISHKLITAQDQERRRIARELHDTLGQELTAAKLTLGLALEQQSLSECKKHATDASSIIQDSIRQVRTISYLLHPPLLDQLGLKSALHDYIEGLAKRSSIELAIDLQPSDFPRLSPELETAIFRIVQESLMNVFRHSEASKAWVTLLKGDDGQLLVTVRDDGKGIPQKIADFGTNCIGVGISDMRQRVKEFGGELRMRKAKPGTIVEVRVPIATSKAIDIGKVRTVDVPA
jgi:signal transduction histidine kinase